MIDTVTRHTFIDTFRKLRPNNFSYEGLNALFDFYEELEDGTGEQIEFDPIAICCEWSEYDSFEEIKENYDSINTEDDLYEHTQFIPLDNGGYILLDF
jgi:hypothetical protein